MYRVYVLLPLSKDAAKQFSPGFSLVYRPIVLCKKAVALLWWFARVFQKRCHDCDLKRTLHQSRGGGALTSLLKTAEEFFLSAFVSATACLGQFASVLKGLLWRKRGQVKVTKK